MENLRKEKHKHRAIHKAIQEKKYEFLKEESNVLEKIPRLRILKQIFSQNAILYVLNAKVNCFTKAAGNGNFVEYFSGWSNRLR